MHRLTIEFYRNGPLQQAHGNDQSMRSFEINDDTFQIAQRPSLDSKSLPDPQKRPWRHASARSCYRLQCGNLMIGDGSRRVPDTHKSNRSGHQEYRQALLRAETAEKISLE
jgi:hypothetical protein